jgi:hypothetical protein
VYTYIQAETRKKGKQNAPVQRNDPRIFRKKRNFFPCGFLRGVVI